MKELTQQRLKELLCYDPDTGIFTNRITRGNRAISGRVAGSDDNNGYRQISLDYKMYFAHRLAWLYIFGHSPKGEIDHINGIKSDNRIVNLREASIAVNRQNLRKARRDSASGLLGASWNKAANKWVAMICFKGKSKFIGRFDTKEDAHIAYVDAKRRLHEGCTI
jgi:hypothetical protein